LPSWTTRTTTHAVLSRLLTSLEFSKLCDRLKVKSYIAALGTAILAKASNPRIDVFSLKAADESPGAYDARRPAEKVLVPASQKYRFSLGVSGPQPLNNNPFMRSLWRVDLDESARRSGWEIGDRGGLSMPVLFVAGKV
jgi:hypothetical protein